MSGLVVPPSAPGPITVTIPENTAEGVWTGFSLLVARDPVDSPRSAATADHETCTRHLEPKTP